MKLILLALLFVGCVKEMGDQPKFELFEGQPKPPPAGTIALEDDVQMPAWGQPTLDQLHRGQERFNIYCSVCHGRTGEGNGMVVQRGFPHPRSYFEADQLALTKEQIAAVIQQGVGRMPSYADKLSPEDRRFVADYVKALQFSRQYPRSKK